MAGCHLALDAKLVHLLLSRLLHQGHQVLVQEWRDDLLEAALDELLGLLLVRLLHVLFKLVVQLASLQELYYRKQVHHSGAVQLAKQIYDQPVLQLVPGLFPLNC